MALQGCTLMFQAFRCDPGEPLECGMQTATLTRHPATPCAAVRQISVRVNASPAGTLWARYSLEGDVDHLRIPAESAPRRADKLWQHTCFEVFIARSDIASYYEFNFAPSGEWATYKFDTYREGMTAVEATRPRIRVHRDAQRIDVEAAVDLKEIADLPDPALLHLALSAVIEENNGRLSYWAVAHPSSQPDFHHADSFALRLDQHRRLA